MKKKTFLIIILALILGIVLYLLYYFNIISHGRYTNEDFKIDVYKSKLVELGAMRQVKDACKTLQTRYIKKK